MILIRTKSIQLTINGSFGENINKFQYRITKKKLGNLNEKRKKFNITRIPFYLTKPVHIYIYIYIYIYIRTHTYTHTFIILGKV